MCVCVTSNTRDTRAHMGTRITQTNLTTIQTHQQVTRVCPVCLCVPAPPVLSFYPVTVPVRFIVQTKDSTGDCYRKRHRGSRDTQYLYVLHDLDDALPTRGLNDTLLKVVSIHVLHTALPSHRPVRQVATVPASPHCHATSSVRQASSSARQSRRAFDIRLAGAIVD